MALGKAVLVGVVASIAIPYVLRSHSGQLGDWVRRGLIDFEAAGHQIYWSLPLFAGVTLIAWLFLSWAEK
ncbi:MAG TPA: hypothetical protein VK403_09175 [Allosphingosinicella sp.]|nr:hypothetical protein [Allosphingosinicella sp.]